MDFHAAAPTLGVEEARACLAAHLPDAGAEADAAAAAHPDARHHAQLSALAGPARLHAAFYLVSLAAALARAFPRDTQHQRDRYSLSALALELAPGLPSALLERGEAAARLGAWADAVAALQACAAQGAGWGARAAPTLATAEAQLEEVLTASARAGDGSALRAQGLAAPLSAVKLGRAALPPGLSDSASLAAAQAHSPAVCYPDAVKRVLHALSPPLHFGRSGGGGGGGGGGADADGALSAGSMAQLGRALGLTQRASLARLGSWNVEAREKFHGLPSCLAPKARNLSRLALAQGWDAFAAQELPNHPQFAGLFRGHLQQLMPGWALDEVDVGGTPGQQGECAVFGHCARTWQRSAPAAVFPQRLFTRAPALLLLQRRQGGEEGAAGGAPPSPLLQRLALLSVHLKSFDRSMGLEQTRREVAALGSHVVPWAMHCAARAWGAGVGVAVCIAGDFNAAAPGGPGADPKTYCQEEWGGLQRAGFWPALTGTPTNMYHTTKCGGKECAWAGGGGLGHSAGGGGGCARPSSPCALQNFLTRLFPRTHAHTHTHTHRCRRQHVGGRAEHRGGGGGGAGGGGGGRCGCRAGCSSGRRRSAARSRGRRRQQRRRRPRQQRLPALPRRAAAALAPSARAAAAAPALPPAPAPALLLHARARPAAAARGPPGKVRRAGGLLHRARRPGAARRAH